MQDKFDKFNRERRQDFFQTNTKLLFKARSKKKLNKEICLFLCQVRISLKTEADSTRYCLQNYYVTIVLKVLSFISRWKMTHG